MQQRDGRDRSRTVKHALALHHNGWLAVREARMMITTCPHVAMLTWMSQHPGWTVLGVLLWAVVLGIQVARP